MLWITILIFLTRTQAAKQCERLSVNEPELQKLLSDELNTWYVLHDVCVEDETIVLYDPQVADGDPTNRNIPNINLGDVQYAFKHASIGQIHKAARDGDHRKGGDAPDWAANELKHRDVMAEHYHLSVSLTLRYPSPQEAAKAPEFSPCTVPALMYTHWPHNIGEFIIRPPTLVHLMQSRGILDKRMTLLMGLPAKMPMDRFQIDLLRPLSIYEPTSFAEFSRPQPPETPSNHTAEGVAVRCFETFLVGRIKGGSYPDVAKVAPVITSHYLAKGLPPGSPPSPWRSTGPDTLRVLIERRPEAAARQFLGLEELIKECNEAPPIVTSSGRQLKVQCVPYVFGANGTEFGYEIDVLSHTDAIVAFHGAGAINILLAPEHTSLVEIRPREFGTVHRGWPNSWHPQLSRQSGFYTFFWGINVEDPTLSPPAALEFAGRSSGAFASRDRHVRLLWRFLRPVLESIAEVDRNATKYEQAVRAYKMIWQVQPGGVFGPAPGEIAKDTMPLRRRESALRRVMRAVVPRVWLPSQLQDGHQYPPYHLGGRAQG